MRPSHTKSSEKGQVLLLVVLASVIALTVGLAAVSRSITSTRISTEESNSQKALSAAEAGVEEQISKTLSGDSSSIDNKPLGNNSFIDASAEAVEGTYFEVNNGDLISQDEGADVWLSTYPNFTTPTTTTLTVYWEASDTNCSTAAPAIEIVAVYGATTTDPSMSRYAIDSCAGRRGQNNFSVTNVSSGFPTGYNRGFSFNVNSGYIARVIPLYADAKIAVRSTAALPPQGYLIESTGSSGDTVRKVQVYQGFPKLPIEFFPYNLFLP